MQWQKRNKKSWQSMACSSAGCFTTLKPQGAKHNGVKQNLKYSYLLMLLSKDKYLDGWPVV